MVKVIDLPEERRKLEEKVSKTFEITENFTKEKEKFGKYMSFRFKDSEGYYYSQSPPRNTIRLQTRANPDKADIYPKENLICAAKILYPFVLELAKKIGEELNDGEWVLKTY
ncbi:MAG TPA: hypothetical protein ENG87_04715 [Candidatus Pacearchaeota archaeon]|nr:hypothetical protein BMS3Abin17_01180 [archaeon BMS3Abin17]HDK42659.1 hypothetical protein [Candidatus Pacearchaeota archaeon]HDZ60398.1 hypothetical protein [Candidatus Pacearchaeota archaeon]